MIWYIRITKSIRPQGGSPQLKVIVLSDVAYPVGRQGRHFLFPVMPIYVGQ